MPAPFLLLTEWDAATREADAPALASMEAQAEGEPHPEGCACPDCAPFESPILED